MHVQCEQCKRTVYDCTCPDQIPTHTWWDYLQDTFNRNAEHAARWARLFGLM